MEVPNPYLIDPRDSQIAAAVAALPETRGIYSFSVPGNPPHLSWSVNLKRRLTRLLVPSYTGAPGGKAAVLEKYRSQLGAVCCWSAGSRLEIALLMYELARQYYPDDYLRRLRLRLPWFIALAARDSFPRLEIANRLARRSPAFGPFVSRDSAQRYEQELLGLFQLRRCTETLSPHPGHPGCIYGEMNQCLRPCQSAVTAAEYASEAGRVEDFLATNGKSAAATLSSARERAAADLDFEQAAHIHKRLERINAASASRDPVVANIEEFNGVALTKSVHASELRLWPMLNGYWQQPVTVAVSSEESRARSLDHELRESLKSALAAGRREGRRAEQLALFSRWYYSSWRDGHWFAFRHLADLNYRRLVREISKMAKSAP